MNYFKTTFRNFEKHRPYSFLNLLGLSIGLCITFIVALYVLEETGYDTQHDGYQNVYRLLSKDSTRQELSSATSPQVPKLLKERIPEIVSTVSYRSTGFTIDEVHEYEGFYYADPTVTNIFSFHFIQGSVKSIKEDPYAIIVSESFAKSRFMGALAVGRTIELGTGENVATYTVGAVFNDFNRKSTFRPNLIVQNRSSKKYRSHLQPDQMGYSGYQSYLKVDEKASITTLIKKINEIYKTLPNAFHWSYTLQPLERVHLYSEGIDQAVGGGSIKKLWIYGIIGVFILIKSLMNFLLLYTSITRQRFKEFAIRQVNGLSNSGLLKMFMVESLLISLASSFLAFLLMLVTLPVFNEYTKSELAFNWNENYVFLFYAMLLVLCISLISGFYFYNFIQKQNSIDVLYNNRSVKSGNFFLGNGAVVVQLIIVCVMLVFSIGYYKQLNFMMDTGKGYTTDNLLLLERINWDATLFENEALKYPDIQLISRGQVLPLYGSSQIYDVSLKGDTSTMVPMELMRVDHNYIPLYRIKVMQGRNFSEKYAADKKGESVIINESALNMLNLDNPIGTKTSVGTIIGVVEDFKFESFHKTLRPLFFRMPETTEYAEMNNMIANYGDLMIKYKDGERENAIKTISSLLKDLNLNVMADVSELTNRKDRDQSYVLFDPNYYTTLMDRVYGKEKTLQKVILCLTLISIFITMFGLIGMSLFKAGRKTKEIGIRKVNGASTKEILILLNKDFTKWALIAFVLAVPISYYALGRWLEGFAYKTQLQWWVFALAAMLVLLIALLSVSFQSYRAAQANPAKTLKNE